MPDPITGSAEGTSPATPVPITMEDDPTDYQLGEFCAFDASPEEFANLSDDAKKILHELVILASRTDVASRRFEVEQAWECRLFERGYQHLLPRRGGGWSLPGEGTKWGPLATADSSALYSTNIYGRDKDIICAAIAREIPKIQFFPKDATNAQDITAAEAANKYKDIYEKNNDLRLKLMELGYFYYTDDRAVLYTRHVLDGQRLGFSNDQQSGNRTPNGSEVTTVYGKLESKVPMQVQTQAEMNFIQIYEEVDVMRAKAMFPWIRDKIKAGSCGIGEIELDKIARVNSRLALLGSYVTGDAMMREVTLQRSWFRPESFFDEMVTPEVRDELLQAFPDGCLVVYAGTEYAFSRNEALDNHLTVTHAMPGNGQNRRALGTSNVSVQKRLNNWYDLIDAFFRRTVPRKLYDADAFDVDALQQQDNDPGGSTPFKRQPGVPTSELVFVEPTPQHQPALPTFIQDFFTNVSSSLSGANPALFGGDDTPDTAAGAMIQRDAALGRIGVPWNMAKQAFNEACRQAVIAAADNRTGTISETSVSGGKVQIDADDLKGNIQCYAEYDSAFPESWRDRETRYTELVTNAPQNPYYAKMLESPANMRAIADNINMAELEVPGELSIKKQLIELEQLTTSAPLPNPQRTQIEQALSQAQMGMQADTANGTPIPPQAAQMIQQLQQQMQSMPELVSSIPVAQDESENHAIEAETCWEWLNGEAGIQAKMGLGGAQEGFQNVYLHWQEHEAVAKKLNPPQQPPVKEPNISIPFDKMPPEARTQALAKAGIMSSPQDQQQADLVRTQHKIAERVVPKSVPESLNVRRITRGPSGEK